MQNQPAERSPPLTGDVDAATIFRFMDGLLAILLPVAELVGVAAIVRLWGHAPKPSPTSRLLWSLLLLVPVFELLFYLFLREEPRPHEENKSTDGASGWSEG